MWQLFRKKKKDPVKRYYIKFNVTYTLGNGGVRKTEPIYVVVPAGSIEQAEEIVKKVAASRVDIKIMEAVEK